MTGKYQYLGKTLLFSRQTKRATAEACHRPPQRPDVFPAARGCERPPLGPSTPYTVKGDHRCDLACGTGDAGKATPRSRDTLADQARHPAKRVQSVQPCAAGRKPTEYEWCGTCSQLRTIRKQERRQSRNIAKLLACHYFHFILVSRGGKTSYFDHFWGWPLCRPRRGSALLARSVGQESSRLTLVRPTV